MTSRSRALGAFTGALLVAALVAVTTGAVHITPVQALAIVGERLGCDLGVPFEARQAEVLWALRLPRVLLGVTVGAALGVSGATLQGVFRNPLADPGLLGVSSGAALGAAGFLVLGGGRLAGVGLYALPAAAFAGGLVAALCVWALGAAPGHADTSLLVLAGVALNALCGAATGALVYAASDAQLRSLTFWTMGSLGEASWTTLPLVALPCAAALVGLTGLAGALDALSLGEFDAAMLGVRVRRVQRAAVALAALAVGAAVAFTGVIGFVGLVVPHLVRLLRGPSHRGLLAGSGLLGAALLLVADTAARTVVAPAELPLGVVCAGFGAPFFAWLLVRRRAEVAS